MLFYRNLQQFIEGQREGLERLERSGVPEVGVILDVFAPNEDQDLRSNPGLHSVNRRVDRLAIDGHGIADDRHRGLTRRSTGREPIYKPVGATIVNRRQLFVVAHGECAVLSERMGVEITPELLGANVVIGRADGSDFCISDVPLSTHLVVAPPDAAKAPGRPLATLVQSVRQRGCSRTGKAIAKAYGDASLTKRFVDCAEHPRGVLCSVEYPVDQPAWLEPGQKIFFMFPMGCCD